MLKAIIIDDERPSLELLKRAILKNGNIQILGEFLNGKEALEQISALRPDVIFSDIEMMELNGIQLAKKLLQWEDVQVVFVTAYEHYALEAFEVGAVNYILKPVTEENLNRTISRLLKRHNVQKQPEEQQRKNKVETLGGLQVYGPGEEEAIGWPTSKAQELFAYFLCQQGRPVDKWQLCDILWPSATPEKANHSLHSTINRMKKTLREAGMETAIRCVKGKYTMDMQDFWWDGEEMMNYLQHNPTVNLENAYSLEKVLDLYHGELFETEGYLWALEHGERINRAYLQGREKLADYCMSCQQYEQAEDHLEAVLNREPASEETVVKLMKLHYLTGNKEKLIRCYRRLEEYLIQELALEPKAFTKDSYKKFLNKI
ncbi:response regulator [Aminipila butyrica]|uniref:Stage 0 sporulation protein A homolog n=1 Tax=Aminipila butyrica TaxID=433296 RepID=A0A858BVX8_9FIRM|nr:response regulator [Aminipila butyrica]QIB69339.1 response regulator [Aminipila butyrica]